MVDLARGIKNRSPEWVRASANRVTRQFGLATSSRRSLPDYAIIGAKRAGTTSLHNYMLRHPGVLRMYPKARDLKSTDFFFSRGRSIAWYRSHFVTHAQKQKVFDRLGYVPVTGEASPYYCWDPRVAPYAREVAPELKAIMLIRDPVKRAWSHYQERVQNGVEPLSFEDALRAEEGRLEGERDRMEQDPTYYSSAFDWYSYRARGEYLEQIKNWHAHFPPEQLLVIRAEDLYTQTQATFDRVCSFLGLPPVRMATTKTFNATWRTKERIPPESEALLEEYFAPLNRRLGEYLKMDLDW